MCAATDPTCSKRREREERRERREEKRREGKGREEKRREEKRREEKRRETKRELHQRKGNQHGQRQEWKTESFTISRRQEVQGRISGQESQSSKKFSEGVRDGNGKTRGAGQEDQIN